MEKKDYTGMVGFAVLTIAAFIVAIMTGNKIVVIAGFIYVVMTQIAYLIAYTKSIKREVESIRQLLIKK